VSQPLTGPASLPCPSCCRVLGLLEDAQRLSLQLEDRGAAAHSAYLQALVHDGLGQEGLRDAGAASFATLIQPVLA
jgi:hypothetical protein